MNDKQKLGQFYTTNYKYILSNLYIPKDITTIIEPFCGNADLLEFCKDKERSNNTKYLLECYDIEPKKEFIQKRDTILNPPLYENAFIITNPPYLARNKCTDKTLFDKYDVNDLYKCFIKDIITNSPIGGIIVVPLNFWSSIQKNDIHLRQLFLERFDILQLNIFEEQVFDDTTYTICAFQFMKKRENISINTIHVAIYPSKTTLEVILNAENNYTIGGHIYNLSINGNYKISRLTSKNLDKPRSNILLKCIDDNCNSRISLSIVSDADVYIDSTSKLSARSYASIVIEPFQNIEKQKILVSKFNELLNENREKYHSLFLSNYRESKKGFARKRISFEFAYNIIEHLLDITF